MALAESEEWRAISDGAYEVSSLGRVRRLARAMGARPGLILKHRFNPRGYAFVSLNTNGNTKAVRVHCLVAYAFLGPRPAGADIDHVDGHKINNAASNLEYVSRSENLLRASRLGLIGGSKHRSVTKPEETRRGVEHHKAKMTEETVREMRNRYALGGISQQKLADEYGLRNSTVCAIINKKSWGHVS